MEKNVTFFLTFGYSPEFHLRYRVFVNNVVGYTGPQGKSHSFMIPLDWIALVQDHIQRGIDPIPPPRSVANRDEENHDILKSRESVISDILQSYPPKNNGQSTKSKNNSSSKTKSNGNPTLPSPSKNC